MMDVSDLDSWQYTGEKVCKQCEEPFVDNSRGGNRVFCTEECAKESKKIPVRKEIRECAYCEEPFEWNSRGNARKYCSTECSDTVQDLRTMGDQWIIWDRDGFRCVYCGLTSVEGAKLCLDHVVPWSEGGSDTAGNLVTACSECNASKWSKPLSERSFLWVMSVMRDRNHINDIHPDKPIKGSHVRSDRL